MYYLFVVIVNVNYSEIQASLFTKELVIEMDNSPNLKATDAFDDDEFRVLMEPFENSEDSDPDFDPRQVQLKRLKSIPDYFNIRNGSAIEVENYR